MTGEFTYMYVATAFEIHKLLIKKCLHKLVARALLYTNSRIEDAHYLMY